jgi:arylformamidase
MLLATSWPKFQAGLAADIIRGSILISGVYELEPLRHIETGEALRLTAAMAKRHSPITLRPASKARLLFCTGGQESAEFRRQTSVLARLWARQGSHLEVISFPMRNHYTILEELALPRSALVRRALDMLED